jgi:hypothetical protein
MRTEDKMIPAEAIAFRYRIVYDSLARLSCNMNKCEDIAGIIDCLNTDIKYLFDCIAIRFCIQGPAYLKTLSIGRSLRQGPGNWNATTHSTFSFEDATAASGTPASIDGNEQIRILTAGYFDEEVVADIDKVWVWPFNFPNGFKLVVSVFSGGNKRFKSSDVPVLKIVCESFFAKIMSLQLLDEVTDTRNMLQQALTVLEEKNARISQMVTDQELIIQQRTRELQERNTKLLEVTTFNGHNIREPLTRITGLLELSKISTQQEMIEEVLPMLATSAQDLDNAIKNVIIFIEKDR